MTKQSLVHNQWSAFAEYWKRKCLSMPVTHGLGIQRQRQCSSPVNLTGCLGHMPRWSTAAGLQSGKKPKEITTLSLSTLSLSTFQDWHPGEQELLYGTLGTMVTINKPPPPHTSHQELGRQESYLLAIRGSYLSITDFLWQPEKTGEELSETIMRSEGLGDAVASLPVCHPLLHRCPSTPSKPWAVQMLDSPQDG